MLNQIFRDFDQKNLNHFLGQTSPIFGANKYEKKTKFRLQISGLLKQIMGLWVQISIEFVQLIFQQLRVLEYFGIHATVFRNVPALKQLLQVTLNPLSVTFLSTNRCQSTVGLLTSLTSRSYPEDSLHQVQL